LVKRSRADLGGSPVVSGTGRTRKSRDLPSVPIILGVRHPEAERYGEEAPSPICPGADFRSCKEVSHSRVMEDIARESGARDDPIEAPAQDGGSVSRV
jgi:hypothetical protein